MKKVLLFLILAIGLFAFFSYHLIQIPEGINDDEAAFGYNATLLSRNLKDENHRFLPIFILARGGKDYLQPVPTYFMAAMVKLFGASLYNLRLTSVLTAVASVILIYFLGKELLGVFGGYIAAIFLATTPIVMIQSHLAFDNITPVPLVAGWLLTLLLYTKTKKKYFLIFSGLLLGISYYSFKSMRIFVPMWTILTAIYLGEHFILLRTTESFKKILSPVLLFMTSLLPFYLVIPWLEFHYAGAVLNNADLSVTNLYNFIYNYIANFDPSFLFIRGDLLLIHSTGIHGMYLLMSLPFFIFGIIYSWKKSSFWKLLIISFFAGPLLFGYLGQIHRANRLLPEIPAYVLICAFGFLTLWQKKMKLIVVFLSLLFVLNYFDFIRYYWGSFAGDTKHIYNCWDCKENAYKILKDESGKLGLTPYIDKVLTQGDDPTRDFARTIYFTNKVLTWNGEEKDYPKNGILMTDNKNIDFLKRISSYGNYYFYISK